MIGRNIRKLRKERGYSQSQLEKKLGISQGAISHWESGLAYPETAQLLSLADFFRVTLDKLADDSPLRDLDAINIQRRAIPVVGEIACGEKITAEENVEGYTDLPDSIKADFALRCKGDSMEPTFRDGDLVLIRQQPEVENGQIAAVGINNEATLKHFYRSSSGITLTAENPLYSPINIPCDSDEEIIIYGLAVGYTRIF